jgi:hypothetical protein
MTVYGVAHLTVTDRISYDRYTAKFMPILQQHNGRLLVADDDPRLIRTHGNPRSSSFSPSTTRSPSTSGTTRRSTRRSSRTAWPERRAHSSWHAGSRSGHDAHAVTIISVWRHGGRRPDAKINRLRAVSPFRHARTRELRKLAAATDLVEASAGTVLWRCGHLAREAHLVLNGDVDVTQDGLLVATIGAGHFVGARDVIDKQRRRFDAMTRSNSTLLVMHMSVLGWLLDEHPSLREAVLLDSLPSTSRESYWAI